MTVNGGVSFWWHQIGFPSPRPALPHSIEVDVAIVGAGYTGLWTAYYLKKAQPDLRIAVLEARFAGFGASGRNGGWLSGEITGGRDGLAKLHGRQAVIEHQRALNATVDEVIDVAAREGIDADIHKGGELYVAYTPAQRRRLLETVDAAAKWPDTDIEVLSASDTARRINVSGTVGGLWHPHCARIHPAKLVRGLAAAVDRLGVPIYENTPVTRILPGRAETVFGAVRANHVLRATEGFTANIPGEHRTWLPMNSSMIVTAPLPQSVWDSIGWNGREALSDFAHVYMYAQRTADDRIAFGGRGVPYRYGSGVDTDGATQNQAIKSLTALLRKFFPAACAAPIEHAWSGVIGVPRDWLTSVTYDRASGLGHAGGYVGTGVTATNLAGRALRDLVLGRDTELTHLPWTNHRTRRWEVEPLRYLAVQAIYGAYGTADRVESRGGKKDSSFARVADWVSGRG
jgi:glycine/D-amino acid oxidase-like deaminating enzyme